jgi:hypothetical protein
MPASRFVVVSAPLEEQLSTSLAAQLRDALALALRLKRSVNATLHDDELGEKASNALEVVVRPDGLPFVLFVLLVAVMAARELLLRAETARILKVHRDSGGAAAPAPAHQHDD